MNLTKLCPSHWEMLSSSEIKNVAGIKWEIIHKSEQGWYLKDAEEWSSALE